MDKPIQLPAIASHRTTGEYLLEIRESVVFDRDEAVFLRVGPCDASVTPVSVLLDRGSARWLIAQLREVASLED